MECSIKEQKIQAMKNYRRAKFVYNFALYSLTSIITCFFFSYPFWFPSMHHFLSSLPNNISFFLNAKYLFLVGNLIIFILVGESKLKQSSSSSSSDLYDEYVARSRSRNHEVNSKEVNGLKKRLNMEGKSYGVERKELGVCRSSKPHGEEKRKGLRSCKSEVWGESKIHVNNREKKDISDEEKKMRMRSCKSEIWGESEILKEGKTKGQKEEGIYKKSGMNHEEKTMGMRSCKSAVWGENGIVKKPKGQREKEIYNKSSMNHEEIAKGMRSCKSAVWGENEIVKKTKGQKEEEIYNKASIINDEEKKMAMRSCKSEVWGENEAVKKNKGQKEEEIYNKSSMNNEEKKMGMRSCKSAVWDESGIIEKSKGKEEEQPCMTREDLNKRVEAFIARVNKRRLLESKLVYDNSG